MDAKNGIIIKVFNSMAWSHGLKWLKFALADFFYLSIEGLRNINLLQKPQVFSYRCFVFDSFWTLAFESTVRIYS